MSGIGRQTHCDYQCRMTQFSFYQASKVGMSVTPHGRTESLTGDRLYPTHCSHIAKPNKGPLLVIL